MSNILFIKDANFSVNAIGKIGIWKVVVNKHDSANNGEVTTSQNSKQTRFWIQFSPVQGKTYKAILSVTNGSGDNKGYNDVCAIRFVATNSAKTGQDIIPLVHKNNVESVEEYTVKGSAVCNSTYSYLYLNINWSLNQPTKYPVFMFKLFEYNE